MWNDNEADADLLGFTVHKDLLLRLVTDPAVLPVTVGLFGDWGGGKSSILRMLQQELENDHEDVACVYFNGWVFEGYADARTALLSSILVSLGDHKRFGPKLRKGAASLLKRLNIRAALAFGATIGAVTGHIPPDQALMAQRFLLGGGSSVSEKPGGSAQSENEPSARAGEERIPSWEQLINEDRSEPGLLDIRTFRADFERLLHETTLRSVVVLIDDLDRCSPERLIDNLEAIKLFLAVPKTAFVIAADQRIMRHAIASRYVAPRLEGTQPARDEPYDLVTDYLEKVIQIPYTLPRLSPSEIETYITLLYCRLHVDSHQFDTIHRHYKGHHSENPFVVYGSGSVTEALGGQLPKELERTLSWTGTITPLLTEGLKGNPRQVKRFLNALMLRKQLAGVAHLTLRDDILVKLMILEYVNPPLLDQLFSWQAASEGRPPQLTALEVAVRPGHDPASPQSSQGASPVPDADPAWQQKRALDWLRLEPALADEDLREYFWVARDKLSATVTGLAMVPPLIRRLLGDLVGGNDGERMVAAREAAKLPPGDQATLLSLAHGHIRRKPDDPHGIDAFRELITAGSKEALGTLVSALDGVPADRVGPDVPFLMDGLARDHPDSAAQIQRLLTRWEAGTGRASVAAKQVRANASPQRPGQP